MPADVATQIALGAPPVSLSSGEKLRNLQTVPDWPERPAGGGALWAGPYRAALKLGGAVEGSGVEGKNWAAVTGQSAGAGGDSRGIGRAGVQGVSPDEWNQAIVDSKTKT